MSKIRCDARSIGLKNLFNALVRLAWIILTLCRSFWFSNHPTAGDNLDYTLRAHVCRSAISVVPLETNFSSSFFSIIFIFLCILSTCGFEICISMWIVYKYTHTIYVKHTIIICIDRLMRKYYIK